MRAKVFIVIAACALIAGGRADLGAPLLFGRIRREQDVQDDRNRDQGGVAESPYLLLHRRR